MTYLWLTFTDPVRGYLGGVVAFCGGNTRETQLRDALRRTFIFECNPGGNVEAVPIPAHVVLNIPPRKVFRLLTREEGDALWLWLEHAVIPLPEEP